MIFVTVGNATQGFRRLLDAIDILAGSHALNDESVVVQSGSNVDFRARHCAQRDYFPPVEFREMIAKAEIVICHGGAGTLHHVFQAGKVPVVMPRRRKYGETLDDQLELVKEVSKLGRIIPAYEPEDIPRAILEARQYKRVNTARQPESAIEMITVAIQELCIPSQQALNTSQ
jgi:UDP-N-acetylglucosamine transferase subunit ALG13